MGGFHYAHDYDTARAGERTLNPPPPPPSACQRTLHSAAPGETRTANHDAALCASLTLLIRQSVNLTRIEEATVSSSTAALPSSSSPTSGTAPLASPTSPDVQHGEASPPAAQEGGEPDITASATPPGQQDDGRININTADAAQLQRMNGVGPVTAQRIIDYRAEHGPYTSVDDLLNVKGIGAKTLEKIRSQAVAR